MGCGPSREEQDAEVAAAGWSGSPKTREPLLRADEANGFSIGAKVESANDLTVTQTQHVHRLGSLTVTENPLLSPELVDLLLLEEYQASEEPDTPDLTGVPAVLRRMLLPGGDVFQGEGKGPEESAKRATYSRQNTYTKTSEGLVNLGFEDHKGAGHKQAGHGGASTSGGPALPSITEGITGKTTTASTTTVTTTSKTHKQKTETKEDTASRKTSSESEAPVIKGSEPSVSSSSESESEDEGGSVVGGASLSLLSQLGGASTSSIFTTASEVSRKKAVPSREMKAALKVLNDSIGKPVRSGQQLTNALNIIQREWLKVSSQKDADPHAVEDYMDAFEEFSKNLLQRVVNLADVNVGDGSDSRRNGGCESSSNGSYSHSARVR